VTGTASIPFPAVGDGLGLAAYHWRKSATWSESSPAVHPRAMSYGPKCDALPVFWGRMVIVTSMAELRERQRVKVALFKGEPLGRDDYCQVGKVIADLRLYLLLAIVFALSGCAQLLLSTHEHGAFRWVSATSGVVMVLLAPVFLWQRRRILNNAAKLLGPGSAAK